MGTSKKLRAKLSKGGLLDLPTGKMKGRADMPSIEKFRFSAVPVDYCACG
jgi:hypothetical protein